MQQLKRHGLVNKVEVLQWSPLKYEIWHNGLQEQPKK